MFDSRNGNEIGSGGYNANQSWKSAFLRIARHDIDPFYDENSAKFYEELNNYKKE